MYIPRELGTCAFRRSTMGIALFYERPGTKILYICEHAHINVY